MPARQISRGSTKQVPHHRHPGKLRDDSSLEKVLAEMDKSDEEQDIHIFFQRSNSNKQFMFSRDDSMGDLWSNNGSNHGATHNIHPSSRQRQSDVGRLRIPSAFATDASINKQRRATTTAASMATDPKAILKQVHPANYYDDDDETEPTEFSSDSSARLGELLSQHDGGSQRSLLLFAESDEE
jgi:hypothetical protein